MSEDQHSAFVCVFLWVLYEWAWMFPVCLKHHGITFWIGNKGAWGTEGRIWHNLLVVSPLCMEEKERKKKTESGFTYNCERSVARRRLAGSPRAESRRWLSGPLLFCFRLLAFSAIMFVSNYFPHCKWLNFFFVHFSYAPGWYLNNELWVYCDCFFVWSWSMTRR